MTTRWQDSPASSAPANGSGLRILIVEDNADSAESMAMLLRLAGHDVRIARDGHHAIDVVGDSTPDVVLLDIGLPGMDGYTVARELHRHRTRKIPLLVAVTGYGQIEDRQRSVEAGIDIHLLKPVDPRLLQAVLQRFMEQIAHLPVEEI